MIKYNILFPSLPCRMLQAADGLMGALPTRDGDATAPSRDARRLLCDMMHFTQPLFYIQPCSRDKLKFIFLVCYRADFPMITCDMEILISMKNALC